MSNRKSMAVDYVYRSPGDIVFAEHVLVGGAQDRTVQLFFAVDQVQIDQHVVSGEIGEDGKFINPETDYNKLSSKRYVQARILMPLDRLKSVADAIYRHLDIPVPASEAAGGSGEDFKSSRYTVGELKDS